MNQLSDVFTLHNGYTIPCVGFGTWQTPDGETAITAVSEALRAGYRHIDAAACYGNERSVGLGIAQAMKAHSIRREELFVTSKVWNTERGYEKTMAAFEKTCADLRLDYLDLYLIHWPANEKQFGDSAAELNLETWRAMTELYKAGKIKAIGVSNFLPHHLKPLMQTEVKPMVNQIEYHPGFTQEKAVSFCKENGIIVEAWSPLGTGRMLANETLMEIAKSYGRSVAQLCIRWVLQNGVLPLPKSVTPVRIMENAQVFDFELTQRDMERINKMEYCGGSGLNPDEVDF